jgi:hypothetical protein
MRTWPSASYVLSRMIGTKLNKDQRGSKVLTRLTTMMFDIWSLGYIL